MNTEENERLFSVLLLEPIRQCLYFCHYLGRKIKKTLHKTVHKTFNYPIQKRHNISRNSAFQYEQMWTSFYSVNYRRLMRQSRKLL